jgi:asparagine synthase (glutamine-hydrolysing)
VWRDGRLRRSRWFALDYPEAGSEAPDALARLDDLLTTGVSLRMRADVPVGGYLSGGLDSTITCALAAACSPHRLRSFSVTFAEPRLDESAHQRRVAETLGTEHAVQPIAGDEIARVFPDVVWHAETPLVRSAPAPLFLLSRLTRQGGIKVVLTGEGADELFLGYDLFKETLVRWFCLRQPASRRRPLLLDRLYPYLAPPGAGGELWRRFFLDAGPASDPLFSHLPRFGLTARIKDFYAAPFRAARTAGDPLQRLRDDLPEAFGRWSLLNRAAYLEMVTLLASYLLSSQGDRMAMAHGVEGRFLFLDHRLFAFAAALPTRSKLRGLREKDVLRRWARGLIPTEIEERPKQPYRAPDAPAFFGPGRPDYVDELLDAPALAAVGVFDPAGVAGLVRRCRAGQVTGFRENQALVAILSTQLWHQAFQSAPRAGSSLAPQGADVLLDLTTAPAAAHSSAVALP